MSNALKHAEKELDILCKKYPDKDNPPIINDFIPQILALVEKFGQSGQSGGSAPYTAAAISDAIKKLCLFKPICDITGFDEEWGEFAHGAFQNNRLSSIFKSEEGKCHYLDAMVWKTQNGTTWHGYAKLPSGGSIKNSAYIKSFPFKPKTFTIDVIETEVAKDDWEFTVKDEEQLKEVFEYYDRYYENVKAK